MLPDYTKIMPLHRPLVKYRLHPRPRLKFTLHAQLKINKTLEISSGSNARGEIGFLADYRRMNVALTRARKYLIVVGDSATVGQDKFFAGFLSYVEGAGRYATAWEYMGG